MITTQAQIKSLEERYPFNDEEIEILARCHDQMQDSNDVQEDFLLRLALASPFSYYFLPGDELKDRVSWIEDNLLPLGFASQLRAAISADPFVNYANSGQDRALERFLEGIADTGRRGPREALRVLYSMVGDYPTPTELIEYCFRLALSCDALTTPNLDKKLCLEEVQWIETAVVPLAESLKENCTNENQDMDGSVTRKDFLNWAERNFPMLSSPLSTFVHHLVFHQIPFPESRIVFRLPRLSDDSEIFRGSDTHLLIALAMVSPNFIGKMSRLYSSEKDGRSFNRLEWVLLGYEGPTLLTVRTDKGAIIGAFTGTPWKEALNFYGAGQCFLFQLFPEMKIRWSTGPQDHFIYMHYGELHHPIDPAANSLPHGIGFGGDLSTKLRFFIPDSLEHCSALYDDDKTFEQGDILPADAMQKFEIASLEAWGVGGEETIKAALQRREEHRELTDVAIRRARVVKDKSQLVKDLGSGFTPSKLFKHKKDVRGRHEFRVDEQHGGYKIDKS